MRLLAIGIMSGTSLDGVDAVLADLAQHPPRSIATAFVPFSAELKGRLLALSAPGDDGLDSAGACSTTLAHAYALAVGQLLKASGIEPAEVQAIGCHGQTVRHRPELGYTIQLNDPALLAERTGIAVVADFRRRDVAAGGQGAPLVPVFHEAVFRTERCSRVIVNIGGISNATSLRPREPVSGFDCGPGNVLMDAWAKRHRGVDYDEDGRWAGEGTVNAELLARLGQEPFLTKQPPRSTGRELFNEAWLLAHTGDRHAPVDVQATLLEFTASTIVDAVDRFCAIPEEFYLCGGGARNRRLATRIAELAAPRPVRLTDELGVPTGHVEAMAFAWLAHKCLRREALDLTRVTGARHPCILGAVYPA